MASFNPDTTWIGVAGVGYSASLAIGVNALQIDIHHMGGQPTAVRTLITSFRAGLVADAGIPLASMLVTGCNDRRQLDGLKSSGLDWEATAGLKASATAKIGQRFANQMLNEISSDVALWAMNTAAKDYTNWLLDNVTGPPATGPQFKLIPWPFSVSVGAGLFYEWQTLRLLSGHIGWQYIRPRWNIETYGGSVYLHMTDIPEQTGTEIDLSMSVPSRGVDPVICFGGPGQRPTTRIRRYVIDGSLTESRQSSMGGINLTKLLPVGLSRAGFFTVGMTDEVERNGILKVRLSVRGRSGSDYWTSNDIVVFQTNAEGRIVRYRGPYRTLD